MHWAKTDMGIWHTGLYLSVSLTLSPHMYLLLFVCSCNSSLVLELYVAWDFWGKLAALVELLILNNYNYRHKYLALALVPFEFIIIKVVNVNISIASLSMLDETSTGTIFSTIWTWHPSWNWDATFQKAYLKWIYTQWRKMWSGQIYGLDFHEFVTIISFYI